MKTSKSALFLFELMIIILVFTFAAAVCTQIFASAFNMSMESRELTMSSMNAQTIAEEFKAGKPDIVPLYFDRNWAATNKDNAYYTVILEEQKDSAAMRHAYVNVYKDNETSSVFSIHVKEFVG
jgi:flagellar basal body-associated protein FliL